jgi:hypothetical protein
MGESGHHPHVLVIACIRAGDGTLILTFACGHTAHITAPVLHKDYRGKRHICYACPAKEPTVSHDTTTR